MPQSRRRVDPEELRRAVAAVRPWLDGEGQRPARSELATAVRLSLRTLAQLAPGSSVEVRVPPHGAVQCVSGPEHTRGTPPNVVETDPGTWLMLVSGAADWSRAVERGSVHASGPRADLARWLPLLRVT